MAMTALQEERQTAVQERTATLATMQEERVAAADERRQAMRDRHVLMEVMGQSHHPVRGLSFLPLTPKF